MEQKPIISEKSNEIQTCSLIKTNQKMRLLFFLGFFLLSMQQTQAQFIRMDGLQEIGAGNYFVHVDNEMDAKRIIVERIKWNEHPSKNLVFNKHENLYFYMYYVNPINTEYVYIIHALKQREGYDIYFIYMENRYRYFFDVIDNNVRTSIIYDPAIENSPGENKVSH